MKHLGHASVGGRTCLHERSQIGDSYFHGGGYSTEESRRIFCDVCRMQRWLEIEAALALSQAELGMIPEDVAERISEHARIELIDLEEVRRGIAETGHSLVPLLRGLERSCGGYAGQFVHHGATTQDIQDTGMSLEMRDVLERVDHDVSRLLAVLGVMAREHRDQLMMGRTHAQPALPMTFGLKVAGWIDELLRHRERLAQARPRILVAQLFGGVGTMAGFGDRGPELIQRFATRLRLEVPAVGWHVSRDRVAEYVSLLAMLGATLARFADEVRTLSRPEFRELEERWSAGQVSSSTMPHKRNPEKSEQVVVLARLSRAQASVALESMIVEHERDYRGTRLEWPAVADTSHYVLTALELSLGLASGLRIHADTMSATVVEGAEAACTEASMLALALLIGKQRAFEIVRSVSQQARDQGESLIDRMRRTPEITALLTDDEICRLFDPRVHVGASGRLIDGVLRRLDQGMKSKTGSG
jgi:adenylosuccinate lyase